MRWHPCAPIETKFTTIVVHCVVDNGQVKWAKLYSCQKDEGRRKRIDGEGKRKSRKEVTKTKRDATNA